MRALKYLGVMYNQTKIYKYTFLECVSLRWYFIWSNNESWNLDYILSNVR